MEEFAKYSKIPAERIFLLRGDAKQREKILTYAKEKWPAGFIVITNYEKMVGRRDPGGKGITDAPLAKALREWGPEILVLDESHKIKDMRSGRTKAVHKLALKIHNPSIKYRFLLTGTPVLKDPTDLFAQFLALDGGATFGPDFWAFKHRYLVDKNASFKTKPNYFPKFEIRPGAIEEISAKMASRSMSVEKEACLDLPPLVRQRIYVELTPAQRKIYEEMRKDLIAFLDDKACVARMALTKALRLMQIASGFAQCEDGTTVELKDTPKELALRELLTELAPDHKLIVWAVFRDNYARIRRVCESLNLPYVELTGDVPDTKKWENVKAFQNDPAVRVCIGHPGSGGIGVNLTASSYSIVYSRDFSLGNDQQSEARNHRAGSEIHAKITRIDLVARKTIDESVLERLERKEQVSDAVLKEILYGG